MNSIDCLIREIQEHEIVEIDNGLDKDRMQKIEERILKALEEERQEEYEEGSYGGSNCADRSYGRKKSRRSRLVLVLAAVLTFALGLTAYAAKENEWDIALIDFMGISNASTLQLENGVVEINQGQRSVCMDYGHVEGGGQREVEMRAASSIGDKNEVYIRIETDYVLPEDFNPGTDYILPEDYSLSVSPNKSGYGAVFTYFAEDNKLGFLLAISNCQDVNRAEISLSMENLYWYHDLNRADTNVKTEAVTNAGERVKSEEETKPEKELLCEGSWDLNWSYHYKSGTETYHMLRPFVSGGVTYYLTKVEVSPISIRLEAFRMPEDRKKAYPDIAVEEIHFSDGTILELDGASGAGMRNGMFANVYIGVETLGDGIDPEEVEMLVIAGEEIILR